MAYEGEPPITSIVPPLAVLMVSDADENVYYVQKGQTHYDHPSRAFFEGYSVMKRVHGRA